MPEPAGLPSTSRALVAQAEARNDVPLHRPIRGAATFVAHLIATARQVPQARERRRADPEDVIAAYRATIARIRALNKHQ